LRDLVDHLRILIELGRHDEATKLAAEIERTAPEDAAARELVREAREAAKQNAARSVAKWAGHDRAKAQAKQAEALARQGDHAQAESRYLEAWQDSRPGWRYLLGAAHAARARGAVSQARRLTDRAAAACEQATGAPFEAAIDLTIP